MPVSIMMFMKIKDMALYKKSNGSYKIISLFDNNALDVDLGKSDSGTDVGSMD